ncbi:MAG TPA: hypothetical protein VN317_07150, partial [Candidatus Methanoperedens sp.]|nr:hypothetical protein [Candidatus Methanoperedens sp.]
MTRMGKLLILALIGACLAGMQARHAAAFSQSSDSYYDAFGDLEGVDPVYRTQVQVNHLGGLRMKTIGPGATQTWTTQAHFNSTLYLPDDDLLKQRTLAATPGGDLTLRSTPWALRQLVDAGGIPYVLRAPAAAVGDNFAVGGMSVARVDLGDVTPTEPLLPVIPAAK